ncbi:MULTISPECIES: Lrp/AsnC family transcriptional regulator [Pseudovibrio]|uniref:Lrp/AsnC family transcriptional regulator n=1 Tax=Stappiaceae TaxID=2821832 RepID=UPI002365DDD1|nr:MULTISPECIES: Lrp/AsnC family transcriptional regulator [Pseudovibrio]MDD7909861.1 Lrp/AsnC family transcriptional regulator [Pseudovibrio exalbescens]MDX5592199.1 Lrp/AsnC family transcriptional regulator [Pseudovibrio sp. SPO723]
MDEIDRHLIALLRRNGRASVSDLAMELKLARATVRSRMEKLQESGEILGFTVVLKNDVYDQPVRGIMAVQIEGKGMDKIVARLNTMPEISAVHTTNGNWDLILEINTKTLTILDDVLKRIRSIDGVASSETNLLLTTRRSSLKASSLKSDGFHLTGGE